MVQVECQLDVTTIISVGAVAHNGITNDVITAKVFCKLLFLERKRSSPFFFWSGLEMKPEQGSLLQQLVCDLSVYKNGQIETSEASSKRGEFSDFF